MRKQDQLQEFIQSLSPAEKRYFKLFSGLQGGDKSYLKLFDTLGEADIYDAESVSKKTGKSKKVLAHTKEHLKVVLFRSLRIFHEDKIAKMQLLVHLSETELLDNKKLYSLSIESAQKGIEMCLQYEQFDYALRFIRLYNSAYLILGRGWIDMRMFEVFETVSLKAANENQYRQLLARFTHLINHETPKQRESKSGEIEKLLKHALLKNEKKALSVTAKILFYRIWGEYYMRKTTNIKKAIGLYTSAIGLLNVNPTLLPVFYRDYIFLHSAVGSLYISTNDYDAAEELTDKARVWVQKQSDHLPGNLYLEGMAQINFWSISIYVQSGKFKQAISAFEKIDEKEEKLIIALSRYILYVLMCMAYLFENDLTKALNAYNDAEALTSQKPPAFYWLNQHLYLFIQFEMGNHSVLEHQLKSYVRWCGKQGLTDDAFKGFYTMMRWLNTTPSHTSGFAAKIDSYVSHFKSLHGGTEAGRIFSTVKLVPWLNKLKEKSATS